MGITVQITRDRYGYEVVTCARTGKVLMSGIDPGFGDYWAEKRGHTVLEAQNNGRDEADHAGDDSTD